MKTLYQIPGRRAIPAAFRRKPAEPWPARPSGLASPGSLCHSAAFMANRSSIRWVLTAAALGVAGCASPGSLKQTPLVQDQVDRFLSGGRDARAYGITVYPDPAGSRFEFANRPHPDRAAQLPFVSPKNSRVPVVEARSALADAFPVLLDTSARQSWATLAAARGLEYRIFSPASGEYPDHVVAEIPGYAGVGNKLVFDELHVESPVYYVAPAAGGLGSLARAAERPDLAPAAAKAREKSASRMPAVLGAATLRTFAYVRFDFPGRAVRFSSSSAYAPANAAAVVANLPLLDWRGRPAVQATLDGQALVLVIDTAGDFDLCRPGGPAEGVVGALALGDFAVGEVEIVSTAARGLPAEFPARLGLGVLRNFAVTLDFKNRRAWFEDPSRAVARPAAPASDDAPPEPIHYRGVRK